jgi:hypothetical protein
MWSGFSELRVTYSEPKEKQSAEFVYLINDRERVMTFPIKQGTATIFSVSGVATLWHGIGAVGIKPDPGCYEDVQDTFAIIEGYAVRALFLIGYGVKVGPELVSDTVSIDSRNQNDMRVQINPGDYMIIKGPWSLKGKVKKAYNRIEFQLSHGFTVKGKAETLVLKGSWRNAPITLPVDDTQPLEDWLVCVSGEYAHKDGKDEFTPAIEDMTIIKTIRDVRGLSNRSGE